MRLIAFTGYARSGKDSAAQCLIAAGWTRIGFADAVREALLALDPWISLPDYECSFTSLAGIVEEFGWEYAKELRDVRPLLQRMGTEAGRDIHGDDCWTKIAMRKADTARSSGGSVVISDCRFSNEAATVRGYGGQVVRIDRPGVHPVNAHASDALEGIEPDAVIVNDGTIEQLHAKVLTWISTNAVR